MRFYAERPARLTRQIIGDLVALAWVIGWILAGRFVFDLVAQLREPAEAIGRAGTFIGDTFRRAADSTGGLPFIGDNLATALGTGTAAGTTLAEAGQAQSDTVGTMATGLAVIIVVIGIVPMLTVWLPLRIRYARAASSAVAARAIDSDLLALRALTTKPVRKLVAIDPDPAAAWRSGDATAIEKLAALELAELGLRAATRPAAPPISSSAATSAGTTDPPS